MQSGFLCQSRFLGYSMPAVDSKPSYVAIVTFSPGSLVDSSLTRLTTVVDDEGSSHDFTVSFGLPTLDGVQDLFVDRWVRVLNCHGGVLVYGDPVGVRAAIGVSTFPRWYGFSHGYGSSFDDITALCRDERKRPWDPWRAAIESTQS
jgi:hypothetical protein